MIDFIYDSESLASPTAESLQQKAIVCPKNETVDEINKKILETLHAQGRSYRSYDQATPKMNDGGATELLYPPEYLNTMDFPSMPQHLLSLKIGTPIMLLRNLNLIGGLCNGTRLIVTQLLQRIIEAKIITGTRVNQKVFLPRILLTHNDDTIPFTFKRKQFPVKLCYAMTINKSQGQSLNKIGVYLPQPIFGHGQLYVALSRATSPGGLKVLIVDESGRGKNTTKNIVYKDFLNKIMVYWSIMLGHNYIESLPVRSSYLKWPTKILCHHTCVVLLYYFINLPSM